MKRPPRPRWFIVARRWTGIFGGICTKAYKKGPKNGIAAVSVPTILNHTDSLDFQRDQTRPAETAQETQAAITMGSGSFIGPNFNSTAKVPYNQNGPAT